MSKRDDKRKLELKRLRLRQLTPLRDDQLVAVAGGDEEGRLRSRCCL